MSATPEGTKRYFQRLGQSLLGLGLQDSELGVLGRTNFRVSPVGFGGYRIDPSIAHHGQALRLALEMGCNLIDTSANYTDGGSEELIGKVLQDLFHSKKLSRDEIVVVTKAGYIQGQNMDLAKDRKLQGRSYSEIVEYSPECWHCISPEFLEDQISISLERLNLDKVDVLLLHNPEYFLKVNADKQEYYRRIQAAFEHLENEVRRGRIQYYGVSSNSFPDPAGAAEHSSLDAMLEIAAKLGSDHHFAVIQMPFNIFETGAAREANNSGKTVLERALEAGMGVLLNRPLNAFVVSQNQMVRLADFPDHIGENVSDGLQAAMTETAALESKYNGKDIIPVQKIAWAHIIRENFGKLADLGRWKDTLTYEIQPLRDGAIDVLADHERMRPWCEEYLRSSNKLFSAMTAFLEAQASIQSRDLSIRLIKACPALKDSSTLSQRVIRLYRSIPGVSSVLVGMRRPEYVRDILQLRPKITSDEARRVLGAL